MAQVANLAIKIKVVKNGNNKFIYINIHVYLSVHIFWLSKFLSNYLCVFGSVRWVIPPHGNRHGPCIFIFSNFPLKFFHPLSLFVGQIWKHLYIWYTYSYIHIIRAILSSTNFCNNCGFSLRVFLMQEIQTKITANLFR